jgi:hypothetical protein
VSNSLDAKYAFAFGVDLQGQLAAMQLEDRQIIPIPYQNDWLALQQMSYDEDQYQEAYNEPARSRALATNRQASRRPASPVRLVARRPGHAGEPGIPCTGPSQDKNQTRE